MKATIVKLLVSSNYKAIEDDARGATYDLTPGFAPIFELVQYRNPTNQAVLIIRTGPVAGTYDIIKTRPLWFMHNGYSFTRTAPDGTVINLQDACRAAAAKIEDERQAAEMASRAAESTEEALITPGELSVLRTLVGLPVMATDGVYGTVVEIASNGIVIIDCTKWVKEHNPVAAGGKKGYKYSQLTHLHLDSFLSRAPETVTDAQAMQSTTLQQIAVVYLATYQGTNSFIQNVAEHLDRKGAISYKQTRAVLNTLLRDYRAAQETEKALQAVQAGKPETITQFSLPSAFALDYDQVPMVKAPRIDDPALARAVLVPVEPITAEVTLPDGTYTVVINDDGEYRTFSVDSDVAWHHTAQPGNKAVYYLTGADNSRDFTFYALLTGGDRFSPKKSLRNARDLSFALTKLLMPDAFLLAGKTYAMRANCCFICNKKLTTPDSIASGIGPICAANNGIDQAALAAVNIEETRKEQQRKAQADIDELFPE